MLMNGCGGWLRLRRVQWHNRSRDAEMCFVYKRKGSVKFRLRVNKGRHTHRPTAVCVKERGLGVTSMAVTSSIQWTWCVCECVCSHSCLLLNSERLWRERTHMGARSKNNLIKRRGVARLVTRSVRSFIGLVVTAVFPYWKRCSLMTCNTHTHTPHARSLSGRNAKQRLSRACDAENFLLPTL